MFWKKSKCCCNIGHDIDYWRLENLDELLICEFIPHALLTATCRSCNCRLEKREELNPREREILYFMKDKIHLLNKELEDVKNKHSKNSK